MTKKGEIEVVKITYRGETDLNQYFKSMLAEELKRAG